jgi:hypothetical protein
MSQLEWNRVCQSRYSKHVRGVGVRLLDSSESECMLLRVVIQEVTFEYIV